MNQKSIGEQIRYHRQKQGMTQQDLGREIGVSWEMVSRYERGVSSAFNQLEAIATALKVDLGDLLQKDYKTNQLTEEQAVRVPVYTEIGPDFDLTKTSSYNYYSAPDWVTKVDKDVFLAELKGIELKTVKINKSGPVYVGPNLPPTEDDTVLALNGDKVIIDLASNLDKGSKIIGVVIAQEVRFR